MKIISIILLLISLAYGFGKNKVQYQKMDWNILSSERYHLYYHQNSGDLPNVAYIWLDDIYADLSGRFGFDHGRPVPVILYGTPSLFEQTNIITEILPEGVGGFTELFKTRVALPFNGSFGELRHVLHHEMVHAFVFGAVYEGSIFRAAQAQIPLWFNEGLAEVLSSGWNREADMYMLDRALHSAVPPPGQMLNQGYIAYKGGQSFLYYLYSTGGDSLFNVMISRVRDNKSAEKAIEAAYGKPLEDLGKNWISELRRIYWPEIGRRIEPSSHAAPVTVSVRDRSRFNQRPRISPDGQRIAFYSDRRDYTRIIITDTTGKQLRQIRQHSLSGSFESFQPISGALAWSPDGDALAFVAKKGGRNDIRIVDSRTGRQRQAIDLPPLSAITGLDWSKDGGRLALTGIERGRTGLYIYNMATGELTALDDSPSTKAFPRFSPDGTTVIYTVTDTAGLRSNPLAVGKKPTSNIAVFDINENESRLLTDNAWNDRQPAFSPDGKSFVFVSDRNGVDNLYIADMDEPDEPRPLTDYTGGAGNPDWAADGSAIVYDNFLDQAWNVWYMSSPTEKLLEDEVLALTRWALHEESGGAIPFFEKRERRRRVLKSAEVNGAADVEAGIEADSGGNDESGGDNAAASIPVDIPDPSPYRLKFAPDLVIFGLGVDTYSGVAGQAVAVFSDIMGDHRVTLAGDVQADFSEYAQVYAAYEYLKMRVNLTMGGFYYKYYSYDGSFLHIYHDLETGGFAGATYPFSMFSRLDGYLLGRRATRKLLTGDESTITDGNSLIGNIGYSFDNILWGITGPLTGLRMSARLHLAPPLDFTEEAYVSGDIDIRYYTHILRRFVWANRVTFGGTAGLDGNRAARRFFLGGDHNWLNYDVNVGNYNENLPYSYYSSIVSPLRGWNYFDVTGDRMLLINSEFRFPFIREVSAVWPLPLSIRYINGAFFMDAGYAWTKDQQDERFLPLPVPPKMVAGYGFGMRANLGIFVLRYDRGWPTDFKGGAGGPVNYFSLGAEF